MPLSRVNSQRRFTVDRFVSVLAVIVGFGSTCGIADSPLKQGAPSTSSMRFVIATTESTQSESRAFAFETRSCRSRMQNQV